MESKAENLSATFIKSSTKLTELPGPDKPEYAFTGRSNVGKSTLINILTGRKNLAKTSGKPGKTQTINHFLIDNEWYLVDLPGYGYAKSSKKAREAWQEFTGDYLMNRTSLLYVFVLVDGSIPPKEADLDFLSALGEKAIPLAIVFTKTDKLSPNKLNANLNHFKEALSTEWEAFPDMFLSDIKGRGREEILTFIKSWNKNFKPG